MKLLRELQQLTIEYRMSGRWVPITPPQINEALMSATGPRRIIDRPATDAVMLAAAEHGYVVRIGGVWMRTDSGAKQVDKVQ